MSSYHTLGVYTPTHTPSSYTMNATLPPLPIELLSTWSTWQPPKSEAPLTPPMSGLSQRRVVPPPLHTQASLPSIAHFDRQVSRLSPITPPQDDDTTQWHTYGPSELRLPPVLRRSEPLYENSYSENEPYCAEPKQPSPTPNHVYDWFTTSAHRSAQFIAEKTCEMVCYLWFSTLSQSSSPTKRTRLLQHPPSYFPEPNASTAYLQFAVSPAFTRFMQKVLETTQVSQSVIVLSLHYIYRLKVRNRFTNGQAGSEYRVAVAALMLANKFVDDNTYTNKTWSEVSGIELEQVNKMEREFLLGIDFDLYVDKPTYESWLNLLKGLVMTKEKDSRQWHRSRCARVPARSRCTPTRRSHHLSRPQQHSKRARSTSPSRSAVSYSFSTPPTLPAPSSATQYYTSSRSGAKRSASDAFSPTSTSFSHNKSLKRTMGLTLDIPELTHSSSGPSSSSSISPSEPLQSFAKLSLNASPAAIGQPAQSGHNQSPAWSSAPQQDQVPQTLVSSYRIDDQRPYAAPQNLYFYALAGSPMDAEENHKRRKARLRYQPPPISTNMRYNAQLTVPMVVQSACASPHDSHATLPSVSTLPHFSDSVWARPHASIPAVQQYPYPPHAVHTTSISAVPAAPFANAGPPGVQFYSNSSQRTSPELYWASRGRQL